MHSESLPPHAPPLKPLRAQAKAMNRTRLSASEAFEVEPRRRGGWIEGDDEILEEPASSQKTRNWQALDESCLDPNRPSAHPEIDVMEIRVHLDAAHDSSDVCLGASVNLDLERRGDVGVKKTVGGSRVNQRLKSSRLRPMPVAQADGHHWNPMGGPIRESGMRLLDRDDLVVEAHRRLKNSRCPVFRRSNDQGIYFAVLFGGQRGFFKCGPVSNDLGFVSRQCDPPIQRGGGERGQTRFRSTVETLRHW